MNGYIKLFILLTTVSVGSASYGDGQQPEKKISLLKALYDSQKDTVQEDAPGPESPAELGATTSMQTSAQCTEKDQNTLPLRYVMGLLREKGASLRPSHDPASGTLVINGGGMIGNCNSMLEYKLSQPDPEQETPYVFQVKIKGCGSEKCDYQVKTAEGGMPKDMGTKAFEPNMNGFMKCLEETGVFKDGQIQEDKIALAEFKAIQSGVKQSSELWFASHGPYVDPAGGVFGNEGNKKPGMGCYYFEDIKKGGFDIYSKGDIELTRKKDQFQVLCKSGNYRLIDQKIGEFGEVRYLQNILVGVRNELLLDEVKKLAKQLKDNDDYSGLDAGKIKRIVEDFEKYIIQPKKDELFGVYKNGTIVQKGLYHKIIDEEDEDKKARLITKFLEGLDELNKYTESPYLSIKSLGQMESFKKKAPVDDSDWYNAALTLNRTINTTRAFSNPYSKVLKRYRTRKDQKFTSLPSISFIKTQRKIDEAQGKYARSLSDKRQLIEDEDYSKVGDLRGQASDLRATNQYNLEQLRAAIAELEQDMYSECCYVRQAREFDLSCMQRVYYRNHSQCAAELEEEMKSIVNRVERMNKGNEDLAKSLEQEAKGWVSVEKDREEYFDEDEDEEESDSSTGYTFQYQRQASSVSGNGRIVSSMLPQQGAYPSMMPQMGMPQMGRMPSMMGMPQMGMSPMMGMPQMGMSPMMGMPQMGMQYQMTPPFSNMGMGGYGMPMGGGYTFGM